MPNYNNSNFNNNPNFGNNYGNNYNNGYGNNYGGYTQNQNIGLTQQQIVQFFQQGKLVWTDYVQGRAGAEAYQLPPGITMARLLDNDDARFYVKGYDDNGRPRILSDNDIVEHVDPEPQIPQLDLSKYATKEDITNAVNDAFNRLQGFVTQNELNDVLSGLAVGNGGRIVRINESNA